MWWDFIIPTTRHLDSLGFPFELPFVCCYYKTLLSNHIATMVGTQFTLYGAAIRPGGCLFAQIAVHTRGCYCIPSGGALPIRHFRNPEGRHAFGSTAMGSSSPASVMSVRGCTTGPPLLPRGLGPGASCALAIHWLEPIEMQSSVLFRPALISKRHYPSLP